MKKIMFILGTRPEAIKMAPLIRLLQKDKSHFKTYVCVTAQHRQQLDSVLRVFDIKPDVDLNIMRRTQDLYDISSQVLKGLRPVLQSFQPDIVLVQGDTTTAFAASLAAFYQRIPVGHIEAGLRTYHFYSPWPEEMNRQLIGRLATIHFAPTELNKENLLQERIPAESVFITGNTVLDALQAINKQIHKTPAVREKIAKQLLQNNYDISRLSKGKKLILITCHRRENTGVGVERVARAIKQLSKRYPQVDFVWPMHLNPDIRKSIKKIFDANKLTNIFCTEPLDYLSFVYLMEKAYLILTDSGGVQEEAPALGTPVLVMRDTTERKEAVATGSVKLVRVDTKSIVDEVSTLLNQPKIYEQMKKTIYLYGDGKASQRILKVLKKMVK